MSACTDLWQDVNNNVDTCIYFSCSVQHRKSEILKRLNDKNPVPADAGGVEMRGKWKAGSASPLAVAQCDTPEPDSSRPQWDKEANVRLSNLPLELTASQMEGMK